MNHMRLQQPATSKLVAQHDFAAFWTLLEAFRAASHSHTYPPRQIKLPLLRLRMLTVTLMNLACAKRLPGSSCSWSRGRGISRLTAARFAGTETVRAARASAAACPAARLPPVRCFTSGATSSASTLCNQHINLGQTILQGCV